MNIDDADDESDVSAEEATVARLEKRRRAARALLGLPEVVEPVQRVHLLEWIDRGIFVQVHPGSRIHTRGGSLSRDEARWLAAALLAAASAADQNESGEGNG